MDDLNINVVTLAFRFAQRAQAVTLLKLNNLIEIRTEPHLELNIIIFGYYPIRIQICSGSSFDYRIRIQFCSDPVYSDQVLIIIEFGFSFSQYLVQSDGKP